MILLSIVCFTSDRNVPKNYRPVSNLIFISKVIEKVFVAQQLNDFITTQEGTSNVNYSVYKSLYPTKMALHKIQNDMSTYVDSGKAVALALLYLCTNFDMTDHSILHECLKEWFGTGLMWIDFYLTKHKSIIILGTVFRGFHSRHWNPLGSVLCPLLLHSLNQSLQSSYSKVQSYIPSVY